MGYIHCTCAHAHPFLYLGNGKTDFDENWCLVRGPLAIHVAQDGDIISSTSVTVLTFKHIYAFPRRSSPKRRLTGLADFYKTVPYLQPNEDQ